LKEKEDFILAKVRLNESSNENILKFYERLIADVGDYFQLVVKDEVYRSFYNNDELKDEDKMKPLTFKESYVKSKWGNFARVNKDLSTGLPYILSSRCGDFKIETIIKKMKYQIAVEQQETKLAASLEAVKLGLVKQFKKDYQDVVITSSKEYKSGYNPKDLAYYINVLVLNFANSSWIKIRYYDDASWSIIDIFNHRGPTTKEGWLEYLSK
jgi:hypothetical protein